MPELGRLAARISSNEPVSFFQKRLMVEDLLSHCRREFDVVYRPGEEPVEGQCPVKGCGQLMEQLKKQLRNKHIHTCLLQEKSCTMGIPLQHLRYCWECFTFHDGRSPEFEEHCASHIPSMTTQHYEVMIFRHTTIRAGYCIECMWHKSSATCRMRAFENTLVLRNHLEEHISRKTWPSKCPDPLCHHIADDEQDYRRHLHNVHHYNKTIYVRPRKLSAKRSCSELDENRATSENRHAQNERPRKIRKSHVSQLPGTGTKELKITFWEPPKPHPEAAQTGQGNQDHSNKRACRKANYCRFTSEAPCTSQDGDNTLSASYDTPELTDTSSVHSISSAAYSVSCSVPIDPRILEPSTATLCHSDDGSKQCDEGSLTEQLKCYTSAEQPEIDSACQTSHEEPTMEILRSEDIAVPETDDMSNPHSLTLSPPSNKLEGELTSNEPLAATESARNIPKPSEMHTIGSNIGEDLASTRPFTRAKAREQAVEALRSQTISQNSTRRAKPYSQEEDRLLKTLMRKDASVQDVTKEFSVHFPGRSIASLQKRWLLIQGPSRRSNRSRPIRHPA